MNCLLVMPDSRDKSTGLDELYYFPLGMAYISAALKETKGLNVININLNQVEEDKKLYLQKVIEQEKIDVVLCGATCPDYLSVKETLCSAKEVNAEIITVAGGGLISGDPTAAMEALEFADYGIIGEGEIAVPQLCLALKSGSGVNDINGLVIKNGNHYHQTHPAKTISNLSTLPWCDFGGFGFDQYLKQNDDICRSNHYFWLTSATLPMLTSRSCPHHCTFCYNPEGSSYRRREMNDVFAELETLLLKYNIRNISSVDEMIGISESKFKMFCERMKQYGVPWQTSFRVTDMTPSRALLLKNSGCSGIVMGLESACDEILKSMRKSITVEDQNKALKAAYAAALPVQGNLIFGDPAETQDSYMKTLEWYVNRTDGNIDVDLIKYYPGTSIYWKAVKEGRIEDRVQYLENNDMAINATNMSDDQYEEMRVEILKCRQRKYERLPFPEDLKSEEPTHVVGTCSRCGRQMAFKDISISLCQYAFYMLCVRKTLLYPP